MDYYTKINQSNIQFKLYIIFHRTIDKETEVSEWKHIQQKFIDYDNPQRNACKGTIGATETKAYKNTWKLSRLSFCKIFCVKDFSLILQIKI